MKKSQLKSIIKEVLKEETKKSEWVIVQSDWKDVDGFIKNLFKSLESLGIHAEYDPEGEGTDEIIIRMKKK